MARLIDKVIGHAAVWERLLRQLEDGRLPHAIGFVGLSGIGKRRIAWALAQALVCESENRPCGECPACRRVENLQSESVQFVEPQGALIKIEAAHQILEFLNLRRLGRARVILIDQAQSLNPQAANALLKAIEEPPEKTYFILVISELSQLLPTLRSRLQITRFAPLTEAQLKSRNQVPEWVLRSARGSFENLENLSNEEAGELRTLAMDFLSDAVNGERSGLDRLLEQTKDRDDAIRAIRFLQQLLRDWSLLGEGESIHSDFQARLQELPQAEPARKVALWRRAFHMEQDLAAHADRVLAFENFYYKAKQI